MKRHYGLAAFWIFAGIMHFVIPKTYEAIVPPPLDRYKREVVQLSGVAEILGGVSALHGRTRTFSRWWLLLTLAGVFPANIWMAMNGDKFKDVPDAALWGRLPFQFVFAYLVWRGTEEE